MLSPARRWPISTAKRAEPASPSRSTIQPIPAISSRSPANMATGPRTTSTCSPSTAWSSVPGTGRGRWPAGARARAFGWRVPSERQFREAPGLHHHLHGDRQEGSAIPAAVRIRRLADHGAARADVGADDQAGPVSVMARGFGRPNLQASLFIQAATAAHRQISRQSRRRQPSPATPDGCGQGGLAGLRNCGWRLKRSARRD